MTAHLKDTSRREHQSKDITAKIERELSVLMARPEHNQVSYNNDNRGVRVLDLAASQRIWPVAAN